MFFLHKFIENLFHATQTDCSLWRTGYSDLVEVLLNFADNPSPTQIRRANSVGISADKPLESAKKEDGEESRSREWRPILTESCRAERTEIGIYIQKEPITEDISLGLFVYKANKS